MTSVACANVRYCARTLVMSVNFFCVLCLLICQCTDFEVDNVSASFQL